MVNNLPQINFLLVLLDQYLLLNLLRLLLYLDLLGLYLDLLRWLYLNLLSW